jgi:hypothetical protein
MKKQIDTIDLTPSPKAYVNMLLTIINDNPKIEERKWAKDELIKAVTIAYKVSKEKGK